jgi:hypothetical protein
MTGSFWAPIIIPIVTVPALAAWLALVWYAAAHPRWKAHPAASAPGATGAMLRTDTSEQAARRQVTTAARSNQGAAVHADHEEGIRVPSPPSRRAA